MLARERKRALFSLGIGAVAACAVAIETEFQKRAIEAHVRVLIAKCEADASRTATPSHDSLKHAIPVCDPSDFSPPLSRDQLNGPLLEIFDEQQQARLLRGGWLNRALAVLAVFGIPLLWYLFLDRVREISAAISGRDRNA